MPPKTKVHFHHPESDPGKAYCGAGHGRRTRRFTLTAEGGEVTCAVCRQMVERMARAEAALRESPAKR